MGGLIGSRVAHGQPPLAVTMGEPAGIGGEILLDAWHRRGPASPAFLAIDDPERLERLGRALGRPTPIRVVADPGEAVRVFAAALPVLALGLPVRGTSGRPDAGDAPAVIASIERAVALVREGAAAAIVTLPIQKRSLHAAGFAWPGHTELLAHLAGGATAVMMLAAPGLRVVPVTVHLALRDAVAALSAERIERVALVTAAALRHDFGVARPRLALAGLNPHAGEGGAMGAEEITLIGPAIERLRQRGLDVAGPLAADSMFHAAARARYDGALCMYHDQALIPIKTLAFDQAVNVTLGLPFVRTSPDHGTALDIAGRGVARAHSLIAALKLAGRLAARRAATAELAA
jgi:4-hydroxythreonine-4-phosphate dehydrogenase